MVTARCVHSRLTMCDISDIMIGILTVGFVRAFHSNPVVDQAIIYHRRVYSGSWVGTVVRSGEGSSALSGCPASRRSASPLAVQCWTCTFSHAGLMLLLLLLCLVVTLFVCRAVGACVAPARPDGCHVQPCARKLRSGSNADPK
jgi:hypothetical protein